MGRAVVPLPDFACGEPGLRFARNIRSFHGAGAAGRLLYGRCLGGVTLSVRNLLDDRRTVYSAYESDRVRRLRSGAETFYRPFATSLLYAYGRSATLTVSYKF